MKKLIGLLVVFIVSILSLNAQDNYGYYGKKNYLDISSSSYIPVLYNLFSNDGAKLTPSGNSLTRSNDWFNVGIRANLGRTFDSNFGMTLELGYDNITLNKDRALYDASNGIKQHESLKAHSILILPRFEISGRNGLLPNGLVHQFGIGVSINRIVKKNYFVDYGSYTTGGPNGELKDQEELFENSNLNSSMKLIQFMYGLKMRVPVSKSLMINYGFRYTIDFPISQSDINTFVRGEIFGYHLVNLIAFDFGLTLPF